MHGFDISLTKSKQRAYKYYTGLKLDINESKCQKKTKTNIYFMHRGNDHINLIRTNKMTLMWDLKSNFTDLTFIYILQFYFFVKASTESSVYRDKR